MSDESREQKALRLLAELVDPDDCWFDHNGDCQAHGFVLEPGEICPNMQTRTLLLESAEQ
jgi:hypothetical protein